MAEPLRDTTEPSVVRGSPERFGFEWHVYSDMRPEYEEQFRRWTVHLAPEDWIGKSILDVGCGMGRNSYWALRYGAARGVAIDVDPRSVAAARRTLGSFPTATVELTSAYNIPYRDEFDLAFSIGVIHHLESPEQALAEMVKAVRPGGSVLIWVYGLENNEWIVGLVSPLRKLLFSRLPVQMLHHLSIYPTALLWCALRLGAGRTEYARALRHFAFPHLRSIVFDQLLPRIAHYWPRATVADMLTRAGLIDVRIAPVNDVSWSALGRKPDPQTVIPRSDAHTAQASGLETAAPTAALPGSPGTRARAKVPAGESTGRGRVALWGVAAALSPLTLLLVNQDWFFTRAGWLDPFHYVGFFMNYDQPLFWPGAYKLARLPWVLSGFSLYQLFPPDTASFVLHGTFLVLAIGATFGALWLAFRDLVVAFLAAVALGFFTHFHGSGGWDYHNAAAGSFYLLSVALLYTALWIPRYRVAAMLSGGATLGLALHCNITFVNLVPFLIAQYLVLIVMRGGWPAARQRLPLDALAVVAGGISVTGVLSAINLWFGREALFFRPLLDIVLEYVADPGQVAVWWKPWSTLWFLEANYLAVPAALLVASGWILIARPRGADQDPVRRAAAFLMLGQYVALCGLWLLWQTLGQVSLQPEYFAYPLIPPAFLALAAILYLYRKQLSAVGALVTASSVTAALFVGLAVGFQDLAPSSLRLSVYISFALAAAAVTVIITLGGGIFTLITSGLLLSAANALGTRPDSVGTNLITRYSIADRCRLGQDVFRSIVAASKFIAEIDPSFDRSRVWYEEREHFEARPGCPLDLGHIAGSVVGTGWSYVTRPWPMPGISELPEHVIRDLARNRRLIVIISRREDNVGAMEARFAQVGAALHPVRHKRIASAEVAFDVHALEASGDERPPRGFQPGKVLYDSAASPLLASLQQNIYRRRSRDAPLSEHEGLVLFQPTTLRDHLALPFVDLPPAEGKARSAAEPRWLMVTTSISKPPGTTTCRIVVQDNTFLVLGTQPCPNGGRLSTTMYVLVPAAARSVRMYIESVRLEPTPIPDEMRLVDMVRNNDRGAPPQ